MAQYQPVNVADINAPILQQNGPLPTTGVATGTAVAVANSLTLTNFYVTGVGGSKPNTGTNFLGQILGDTP